MNEYIKFERNRNYVFIKKSVKKSQKAQIDIRAMWTGMLPATVERWVRVRNNFVTADNWKADDLLADNREFTVFMLKNTSMLL